MFSTSIISPAESGQQLKAAKSICTAVSPCPEHVHAPPCHSLWCDWTTQVEGSFSATLAVSCALQAYMTPARVMLHVPGPCVTVVGVRAEAAQRSDEPEDEATHAETRGGAADALGDGGGLEGTHTHIAGEGDHGDPSTAAAKVDGRPAVLSISTAPDG